jgi:hypothetical protein
MPLKRDALTARASLHPLSFDNNNNQNNFQKNQSHPQRNHSEDSYEGIISFKITVINNIQINILFLLY